MSFPGAPTRPSVLSSPSGQHRYNYHLKWETVSQGFQMLRHRIVYWPIKVGGGGGETNRRRQQRKQSNVTTVANTEEVLLKNGLRPLKTKLPFNTSPLPEKAPPDFVLRGPNPILKVIKLSCV